MQQPRLHHDLLRLGNKEGGAITAARHGIMKHHSIGVEKAERHYVGFRLDHEGMSRRIAALHTPPEG